MSVGRDNALGIYISIPFCRSKCTYCNFASGVYPASEHISYVNRVIADMTAANQWAREMELDLPRQVDTVYLGGGTPSLLAPDLLKSLFAAMRSEFEIDADAEITVECAPGQLSDEVLAALVSAGVNRVSLGVQSFIDREAHESGRLHSRTIVADDLRRLRAVGITNLNADLIAGLAGQTFASWQESLDALIDSGVPHASVYMLEVDEDSRLGREMLAGGVRYHASLVPSDETIARMYSIAIERLARAGLAQYEISNFCRPGFGAQHNLRYWLRRPYLGLGLDASSMLYARAQGAVPAESGYVLRSTTSDDLTTFLQGSQPPEIAWLSGARQHEEAWFLGLRLNAGVDVSELEAEFGEPVVAAAIEKLPRLKENGLVTSVGNTVRLTRQGQLLSNEVFQEFLGLEAATDLVTSEKVS
ncbi:MAG TPA: radical SAM family heme chaperone HemW [Terracidiphilus sp.]|nr:radical SAM family heme chaperone HemW [Terracidiphilus sp.]